MNEGVLARGNLARVRRVADDGQSVFLQYLNGLVIVVTNDFEVEPVVGQIVLVNPDDVSLTLVPSDLWPQENWVGIVRLKLDDVTVVETHGQWREIPTSAVPYGEGNTVEGTDSAGVMRVLSELPLKQFDLPAVDDNVIETFLVQPNPKGETFDDFGGLDEVVMHARKLVEVTLNKHKELAAIGARPVKGVLFTGPPGTGKTMLARIIANSTKAVFYEIRGPEVLSKWYGQSEELLRQLFAHAASQERAIIFFDEIDSIAAHRTGEAHEVSRRVVAQLLSLMDGFANDANVVVIAATNRPNDIDDALRRPGRFDWEIAFPMPNQSDREAILTKASSGLRTTGDLSHALFAGKTEGWSAAELTAIWTEAAHLAVQDDRDVIVDEDYAGGYEQVASAPRAEARDIER